MLIWIIMLMEIPEITGSNQSDFPERVGTEYASAVPGLIPAGGLYM